MMIELYTLVVLKSTYPEGPSEINLLFKALIKANFQNELRNNKQLKAWQKAALLLDEGRKNIEDSKI